MRRLLIAVIVLAASCAPAPTTTEPRIAVLADSMYRGNYDDRAPIYDRLNEVGNVVHWGQKFGATIWEHPDTDDIIGDPSIDIVVLTEGLNETARVRDSGLPISTVLARWSNVIDQAHASGQCVVWNTTQLAAPLNSADTQPIIDRLNTWIRAHADAVAEWGPTADEAHRLGLDWFEPDGFHPRPQTWAADAQGILAADAATECAR